MKKTYIVPASEKFPVMADNCILAASEAPENGGQGTAGDDADAKIFFYDFFDNSDY